MNETRDLIIGIDLRNDSSQLCYYDRNADEPRSLPVKVGSSQYEVPTCLCRRVEQKDYCIGIEAEYFAREKGGFLIEDLCGISQSRNTVQVAGEEKQPWEILAYFLEGMLKLTGVAEVNRNIRCLTVAMESLDDIQVENLQKAGKLLEIPENSFIIMDHEESFYYYIMGQKAETWNRSVGWYNFDNNHVTFRKMVMSSGAKPVMVKLEDPIETDLNDTDDEQRDADFYTFAKNTLGNELYSSIQIDGTGFDQEWAQKSVKLLCYQKRKVFYGNNLFAKGACIAGKDRLEDKKLKGYRYLSDSLVTADVGMDMRVMGSPAYYPLIESGSNWYECSASCELILDDTSELVFVVSIPEETEKKRVAMALEGLPKRPNRTSRLSLTLKYVSPRDCEITVEDLGFGEMYPSSGKIWRELVRWDEQEERKQA